MSITSVILTILLVSCSGGGSSSNDNPGGDGPDKTAPANISLTGISTTASSITFTWNDPADENFDYLTITYSGKTVDISKGTETYTISSLKASTQYKITAKSIYTTDDESDENEFYVKTTASGEKVFTSISNADELNNVRKNLSGNYLLAADINLSDYTPWNPIGETYYSDFDGTFIGNGHTISNLTINSNSNYRGLFGYTGSASAISSLTLTNVNVAGGDRTGALSGCNYGTISDCTVSGKVSGTSVGGLVGINSEGTISNCYAICTVSGTGSAGGLVGSNSEGIVSNCYATGSVSGTTMHTGGLAGYNDGTVSNCYATGSVSGNEYVGGLVGYNSEGIVSNSYATGSVSGNDSVGGLAGRISEDTISYCYATGPVNGIYRIGGLIGDIYSGSTCPAFKKLNKMS